MITTTEVKDFLKIPHDDDDAYIESMIQVGYDYLSDAIEDYSTLYSGNETFARKCDFWLLHFFMPDAYDQREGAFDGQRVTMNFPARAMLTQLQLYEVEEESTEEDTE